MLRITLSKAGEPSRSGEFDKREITIGRTSSNDLVIPEPGVSSSHARVLVVDGELTLIDLESTNGTFVNGRRIQGPHALCQADEVYICAHRIEFVLEQSSRPQPAPVPSRLPSPSPDPAAVRPPDSASASPQALPTTAGEGQALDASGRGGPPQPPPLRRSTEASTSGTPTLPPLLPPPLVGHSNTGQRTGTTESAPPPQLEGPASARAAGPGAGDTLHGGGDPPPFPARTSAPPPTLDGPVVAEFGDLEGDAFVHEARRRVFLAVLTELAPDQVLPDTTAELKSHARALATNWLRPLEADHPELEVSTVAEQIVDELCELGPLEGPLHDPETREVFVHGPARVLVRRGEDSARTAAGRFSCPQAIELIVRRLTGHWFDVGHPVVDAQTPDGREVHAVHDSVATGGPVVLIGMAASKEPRWSLEGLLGDELLTPPISSLLRACVEGSLNIALCPGPGAQAFPLLAALCAEAPEHERQVLVRSGRDPGVLPTSTIVLEGAGLVAGDDATVMEGLVRMGLGLAPDRLIVHDLSGPEADDVLAAMARGLQGTLISVRAASARHGLTRLATLMGLAGSHADTATREMHVAQSIELLVALGRFPDGKTRITQIAEPRLSADGIAEVVDIVTLDPHTREWTHGDVVPEFFADLQRRGIAVDLELGT